jgi:DNA-binding beta-propeller fold protein YncE
MLSPNRRNLIGSAFIMFAAAVTPLSIDAQSGSPAYANFEAAQTNPVRLSSDGKYLFAVNTANSSLSVFDVSQPASPNLLTQIPVGLGPVSVNPRNDFEAWVVNQVSNSISVVTAPNNSWKQGLVTGTINLKVSQSDGTSAGEPMDVVFTGSAAYASISRAHQIAVIDQNTQAVLNTIQLFGGNPRAMAVSPDGGTVYTAFAMAGNASTIIPINQAPTPCGTAAQGRTPCSPAMNPLLPLAPPVPLIVSATDAAWYPSTIKYTMPDYGVAALTTGANRKVTYYSGVGTTNLGLAVNPSNGDLFVANTDALNLINFEPNLCGHWVNNRITHIQVATGTVTPVDLNPSVVYGCAPNNSDLSSALAQPTAVVFDPSGNFMYVAAFGTDRVAKVNTSGTVLGFVEVSLPSGSGPNADPANKRGPRGLALNANAGILYSLNRISNTISVIPTSSFNAVSLEIQVGTDPTPSAVKAGRGFMYDAKLSGTGTGACASCHIDSEMDHLAWSLGDPTGEMTTFVQNGQTFTYHPMKGPMTTQTLRGLQNLAPYHWRGDKPDLAAFNVAFAVLMGGTQISDANMTNFAAFTNSVLFLPNPNQNLDRSYSTSLSGGDAQSGYSDFLTVPETKPDNAVCQSCHAAPPGPGSNLSVQPADSTHAQQPIKVPQLRAIYQKQLFNRNGNTIDGFGMTHDGSVDGVNIFLRNPSFANYSDAQKSDIAAFLLSFDTGTAPAVGYTLTLTKLNVQSSSVQSGWTTLTQQAAVPNIDLIGRGTLGGVLHGLLYQPSTKNYITDTGATYTQTTLQNTILNNNDTLSIMGVYPGTGSAQPQ